MPYCSNCGKKETRNRIVDPVSKNCSDCSGSASSGEAVTAATDRPPPPTCDVDDDETLNNVRFGSLKKWFSETIAYHAAQIDDRLTREIGAMKEDLQNTKTALAEAEKEISSVKKDLADVKKSGQENAAKFDNRVKVLEEDTSKQKTVSDNNLKYLINLDRNDRRKNIIIFGVPEDGVNLTHEDTTAITDENKCKLLLEFIGAPIIEKVIEMFRLGKATKGKVRPIKLKFLSSADVTSIFEVKDKLKDLNDHTIYIKPDKTKAEVAEFRRIGDRKQQLVEQYPVPDGQPPRVVLGKGVLTLDGVKVDEFKPVQSLF